MLSTGSIVDGGLKQLCPCGNTSKLRAYIHTTLQNPVYPAFFREGGVYRLGYTRKGVRLPDTIVVLGFIVKETL
jgi:hypothetical protein